MKKLETHVQIDGTSATVGDFWSWAYSDILNNRNRGIFAEFLVGHALDVLDEPRLEWDGHDLLYQQKRIEVKSAAYLQSWQQEKLSTIRFDIAEKQAWDAKTNVFSDSIGRHSDCYVFCLFASKVQSTANVLDISQWEFYVVSTASINRHFPAQKSMGLKSLQKIARPIQYQNLQSAIDHTLMN